MSKIGDLGRGFVNDFSGLADAAKEKAETLKSKAGQQFGNLAGLASRKSSSSSGSAPPRQPFGAQFAQKMTDIKQSAAELKQDTKAFGSYLYHGDSDSKAAMKPFKPDMSELKSFSEYIINGDGKSPAAQQTAQTPQTASNTGSAPLKQPRRNSAERLRRESQTPQTTENNIPQRQPRRNSAERLAGGAQTPQQPQFDPGSYGGMPQVPPQFNSNFGRMPQAPQFNPNFGGMPPPPQFNAPGGFPPQGDFYSQNGFPPQGGFRAPPDFGVPPRAESFSNSQSSSANGPPPAQPNAAPEPPASSSPPSSPERQAALQALGLPDTLGEAYVADKMKTPQGRRELMDEVVRASVSYSEAFQNVNQGVDPNSDKGKVLDQACDQLLAGLNETKASLLVIANAEIPEDKRSEALKHIGVDSPMSMAYLEANATTPEGVEQMKAELQQFDRSLKIAYKKGALAKHPDKLAVGMNQDSPQYQKVASDFKAFESSSKGLLGMVEGLQARLEQLEARAA